MPKFCKFLPLFLLLSYTTFAQNNPDKEEWQSLFNGKDLKNWDIKIAGHKVNDNYKNTFIVEDTRVSLTVPIWRCERLAI